MLWTCEFCGCQGIAGSLTYCPMCFREANEVHEEEVLPEEVPE